MTLAEHIAAVREAKAAYTVLNSERNLTANRARYEELKLLVNDQTNVVYNAVQALIRAFKDELGIWPFELSDLCQSYGYVVGNVRVEAVR